MQISKFEIEGLLLLEPHLFEDNRGFFYESYNAKKYNEILGDGSDFVQDNISVSKKHVLRGLHFQKSPFGQGKLVTVLNGKVLDVAVDIRLNSKTFGQHQAVELSAENKRQFWIPPGFAHGFIALEEETLFSYKCTNYYSPEHEKTLLWNDPILAIDWGGVSNPIISEKDLFGQLFQDYKEEIKH
ncbi:MAG: dTDP-4-dehydrorhamnose 3,5-epimerase [Bacteroidota bacterium]|jgi:dTDP-4-dehydrorhamnose 3,5-epimerase